MLRPLPEIPSIIPVGQDDTNSDVFSSLRRLGLTYLDENGEQLEFSAGEVFDGNRDHQIPNEEIGSDFESDVGDMQSKLLTEDFEGRDYWPYPSKTVSRICWKSYEHAY